MKKGTSPSLATLDHKLFKIKILKVRPLSSRLEKDYFKNIKIYKSAIDEARQENNEHDIELYKKEIQTRRSHIKRLRPETYVIDVYLKVYKQSAQVELSFDKKQDTFAQFIKKAVDQAKHVIRQDMKASNQPRVWYNIITSFYGSEKSGFVFAEEGSVLKAHVKKNMKLLLDGKTPTMPRKYIGIELEFCAPIREEHFALKLFQNGIHKYAQLKQDGSLRPKEKEHGFELAILLEEHTYKKGLKKIIDVLKSVKAVVKDRRCGLHVHLDMRRRNKELVYNNFVACQYSLLSIVDPVRYDNEFCKIVRDRKFPTEFTGDRQERYKTINAAAYYKYKTLEVRMHEGSVDYNEIVHWVDLLIKIANYSKKLKDNVTKLPILRNRLKLKDKLYNYVLERSCGWQVQNNPNIRNMREDAAQLRGQRLAMPLIDFEARGLVDAMLVPEMAPIFQGPHQGIQIGNAPIFQPVPADPGPVFDENLDMEDEVDYNN